MSGHIGAAEYVVKDNASKRYLAQVGSELKWVACQFCATRFVHGLAHKYAHVTYTGMTVVRIKRKS